MRARDTRVILAKFLSPDKVASWNPGQPQSWNRYSYVGGNPLKYVDPDGNVRLNSYEENAETRAAVGLALWSIPVVGPAVAWAVDTMFLSDALPSSPAEASASLNSGLLALGTPMSVGASRIGKLGAKLENIFTEHLKASDLDGAAREAAGKVVKWRRPGVPYNHVREVDNGRRGAANALRDLARLVADPRLSAGERRHAQLLLREYSRKLDAAERELADRAAEQIHLRNHIP